MINTPATAPVQTGAVVSSPRRWFGVLLVAATLFLIFAGAQVKSHEAGLSVPDWPASYSSVMPPMQGGIFYEHGHRMVAATVGLATIVLAVWTQITDRRAWMRRLAWLALAAVVAQGVLGGLTVWYRLPTPLSMSHGTLAQLYLCLVAWIAYACSGEWRTAAVTGRDAAEDDGGGRLAVAWNAARLALVVVFVQLVLGAWMRHSEAGLAVPFFPVRADGAWLPDYVDRLVVIHMLHRAFAFVVLFLVLRAALVASAARARFMGHAAILAALVVFQGVLGASVIWTAKQPLVTSLHVTTGATILVVSWLLVLRIWRVRHGLTTAAPALEAA